MTIKTSTLVSVRLLHMGDNFKTNRLLKHVSYAYMASLVTAYAALRPRDGFSHPHQEHMKDTYRLVCTYSVTDFGLKLKKLYRHNSK